MIRKFNDKRPTFNEVLKNKEIILVHDPMMSNLQFESASMWIEEDPSEDPSGDYWSAMLDIKVTGFNADQIIARSQEILNENTDYPHTDGFSALNPFMQFTADLPFPFAADYLESFSHYQYYVNGFWNGSYSQIPINGKYFAYSPTVVNGPRALKWRFSFLPVSQTSKEDLIRAVRDFKYILIHMGVGVTHLDSPSAKIYTNGKDHFVDHPLLGRVGAGLNFIDFSQWDGEKTSWSKEDLSYTGD